jgi:hypothetical protein
MGPIVLVSFDRETGRQTPAAWDDAVDGVMGDNSAVAQQALGDGQSGVVQEQVLLTAYRLGRDNFLFANLKSRRAWRALIPTCQP